MTQAHLSEIESRNDELNCFVTVAGEQALSRAAELDSTPHDERQKYPLFGIPIALKDNIATRGIRTTAGSPILRDWFPDHDADVVAALDEAGAVMLGKLNMSQFALRSHHADFGEVRNPWDPSKTCAVSSSGSGCAPAAGLAAATFGSDTAGSVRLPAAVCGIVGLKPTYGRVSTRGVFPAAASLDHLCPMARTADDVLRVLEAVSKGTGRSPTDAERNAESLRGVRIGVAQPQADAMIDPEMNAAFEHALAQMEVAGAVLVEVEVPSYSDIRTLVFVLAAPEIASVHMTYLAEAAELYSPEVRQQIALGALIPASDFVRAQHQRSEVVRAYTDIMESVDVLALPVIPMPAWPLDAGTEVEVDGEVYDALSAATFYCPPFNVTGQPAVSVPSGFSSSGLPLAFQLAGKLNGDAELLRVAAAYQALGAPYRG